MIEVVPDSRFLLRFRIFPLEVRIALWKIESLRVLPVPKRR
jgi:hypothetical protein